MWPADSPDHKAEEARSFSASTGGERQPVSDRPWHQTWWAAAIWLFVPLIFWYGLYVFFAKLTWKGRGATAGTYLGVLATIFVVVFLVTIIRGDDQLSLAETDYERQAVLLFAAQRDAADEFGTAFDELANNPDLLGRSFVQAARPVIRQYRSEVVGIREKWNGLDPPSHAEEFHRTAAEFLDFEIDFADAALTAETEQELFDRMFTFTDEEDRRAAEVDALFQEVLQR